MTTYIPFVFEPCRDFQEEIEKSVFQKFGDDIQPLWIQIKICFQAHFLEKYGLILKNWGNILPPEKSQREEFRRERDEFRKELSQNLKLIKSASEREWFKKEAKKLFGKGPKRLSSPKNLSAMENFYKKLLEDAKETLISQIDYLEILKKGKEKGFITNQEIDRLIELRKDSDWTKFGEELKILLRRFPDKERKALQDAWPVACRCARRYCSKTEQDAIFGVVRRLLRPQRKIPHEHRHSHDEILLGLCERFRRKEGKGGIEHYYNKTIAKEWKNFHSRRKRLISKKECPVCDCVLSTQADSAKEGTYCPNCQMHIPEVYFKDSSKKASNGYEDPDAGSEDNSRGNGETEEKSGDAAKLPIMEEIGIRILSEKETQDLFPTPARSYKIKKEEPAKKQDVAPLQWQELSPRERQIVPLRNRKIPIPFKKIGQRYNIHPGTARKTWCNAKLKLGW
jgi:hypothetical protein